MLYAYNKDPALVKPISNNIRDFSLSMAYDAKIVYCTEVSSTLQLPYTELCQMVSGEVVVVNIKHRTALSKQWTAPLVFSGNESFITSERNAQGQLSRRVLLFTFNRNIPKERMDTSLELRVQQNIAAIIVKANKAFRALQAALQTASIETVLPPYFQTQMQQMQVLSNVFRQFLQDSSMVEIADPFVDQQARQLWFITKSRLQQLLKDFCTQNNMRLVTWEGVQITRALEDYKIEPATTSGTLHTVSGTLQAVYFGIRERMADGAGGGMGAVLPAAASPARVPVAPAPGWGEASAFL